MKVSSVRAIFTALRESRVNYLVVGGLAVNAYGLLRFTKDADLVVELVPENIERAFAALATLGYQPRVPITSRQFADAELRGRWIREKGMRVLQFWSDQHRETPIDIFVEVPFDFAREIAQAPVKEMSGIGPVAYATLSTLIALKEAAGRDQDLIDLKHLRSLPPTTARHGPQD
jgi:hypothetical protein